MRSGETWVLEINDENLGTTVKLTFTILNDAVRAKKDTDGLYFLKSNNLYFKSDTVNETWESIDLKFEQSTGAAFYLPQPKTQENTLSIFSDNSKDVKESSGCTFFGWKDNAAELNGSFLSNVNPGTRNIFCKLSKVSR